MPDSTDTALESIPADLPNGLGSSKPLKRRYLDWFLKNWEERSEPRIEAHVGKCWYVFSEKLTYRELSMFKIFFASAKKWTWRGSRWSQSDWRGGSAGSAAIGPEEDVGHLVIDFPATLP